MALAQVASLVGALNRDWVFVSIAGGGKAWKMIREARVAESFEAIGVMEPAQRLVPWSFAALLEGACPETCTARRRSQKHAENNLALLRAVQSARIHCAQFAGN